MPMFFTEGRESININRVVRVVEQRQVARYIGFDLVCDGGRSTGKAVPTLRLYFLWWRGCQLIGRLLYLSLSRVSLSPRCLNILPIAEPILGISFSMFLAALCRPRPICVNILPIAEPILGISFSMFLAALCRPRPISPSMWPLLGSGFSFSAESAVNILPIAEPILGISSSMFLAALCRPRPISSGMWPLLGSGFSFSAESAVNILPIAEPLWGISSSLFLAALCSPVQYPPACGPCWGLGFHSRPSRLWPPRLAARTTLFPAYRSHTLRKGSTVWRQPGDGIPYPPQAAFHSTGVTD